MRAWIAVVAFAAFVADNAHPVGRFALANFAFWQVFIADQWRADAFAADAFVVFGALVAVAATAIFDASSDIGRRRIANRIRILACVVRVRWRVAV